MAELKKLEPGKTLIKIEPYGVRAKNGTALSEPQEFMLFYGNLAAVNGSEKMFHIDEGQYYRYLESFLESAEGKRYEQPTEEEIREAIIACIKPPQSSAAMDKMPPVVTEDSSDMEEPHLPHDPESLQEDSDDEYEDEEIPEEEGEEDEKPEKTEPVKKKKKWKSPFRLFRRKQPDGTSEQKASENPSPEEEPEMIEEEPEQKTADESAEVPEPEPYEQEAPVMDTVQEERIRTMAKEIRQLKLTGIILVIVAMLPCLLYALGVLSFRTRPTDEVKVISLVKDIKAGDVIQGDEFAAAVISREQFEQLSAGTAVDPAGNAVRDYIQLWSNRNFISGKYATADLKEGDYLFASDYAVLKNGVSMIELDIDGTKVKVPVSATAAGSSNVRLYAIVTSKGTDQQVTSFAVNLGEMTFSGKTLKNVLDTTGKSVLQEMLKN